MKQEVSRRCKDLATFMENLMEEVSKSTLQLDLPQNSNPTDSVSNRILHVVFVKCVEKNKNTPKKIGYVCL